MLSRLTSHLINKIINQSYRCQKQAMNECGEKKKQNKTKVVWLCCLLFWIKLEMPNCLKIGEIQKNIRKISAISSINNEIL